MLAPMKLPSATDPSGGHLTHFCQTKEGADELFGFLFAFSFSALFCFHFDILLHMLKLQVWKEFSQPFTSNSSQVTNATGPLDSYTRKVPVILH